MPVWLLYALNGIAAILVWLGWRRQKVWIVSLGQAVAYLALIIALFTLLE